MFWTRKNVEETDLNRFMRKRVKQSYSNAIAEVSCFTRSNNVQVAVRLMPGCSYDDIEDFEQWMFDEILQVMAKNQTVEFFWQLTR